ncbi:hypothetical protein P0W64_06130 [Tsukamurella sp. 8F]|uniref:hypothetical protein n=1 Tax=unclassified Tsukamurella TaxID=2633480 RepID=UPI0023B8E387|nr:MULTISPECIES: hypothetical protein [unclassified Tsukamurella]MDF0528522.1 hypothetical protein [Tsukamurella sp. 8J]MDF0586348.1 hypothetical protein [Tsukamurella sp. 8F]
MRRHRDTTDLPRGQVADIVKERIYVTFTALTVLIALGTHDHVAAGDALWTLILTVAGTVAAVTLADVIAHIVAHERLMNRAEFGHALKVAIGAVSGVSVPVLLLIASAAGALAPLTAVRIGEVVLALWLVGIGVLAVRRVSLTFWHQVIVLAAEAALGLGVIALKLLAH